MIILTNTEKSFHRIQPLILIKLFKELKLNNISLIFIYICGGLVTKSCPILVTLWTVACQASLSIGFSRQEYWSGLPFPAPGDLPHPRIEPRSPALQTDSLLTELWRKPHLYTYMYIYIYTYIVQVYMYIYIYIILNP